MLASVKAGRYLEAGNPTGLTGLFNHPSPRSTLLYLYGSILDKLKAFPEHSVYRQSTEALTKYRMNIIESIKAEGYEEWAKRAAEKVQKYPEAFQPGGKLEYSSSNGNEFVTTKAFQDEPEGTRSEEEEIGWAGLLKGRPQDYSKLVQWEPEPPLEASQYVAVSWL